MRISEEVALQVLTYAAEGYGNKAIATRLSTTTTSIKNYMRDIYKWLKVSNRAEAVLKALDEHRIILPKEFLQKRKRLNHLSPMERRVAYTACQNLACNSNWLGHTLNISADTARKHLRNCYRKLDVHNFTALAALTHRYSPYD